MASENRKIWSILRTLILPLRREWPFFIFAIILLRPAIFHNVYFEIIGDWFLGQNDATWKTHVIYWLDFATTVTFSAIFTYIVAFSGKVVKQGSYILMLCLFLISLFLSLVLDRKINLLTLQQIFETNNSESKEFLSVFALSKGGIASLLLTLFFYAVFTAVEKYRERIESHFRKLSCHWIKMAVSAVLLLTILAGAVPLFRSGFYRDKMVRNYPVNTLTRMGYSLYGFKEESDKMGRMERIVESVAMETFDVKEVDDSIAVIYILGESFIKSHAQIYGYRLPTTPRLVAEKERGNLFAFSDAVSPYCSTTEMLKGTFFMNSSNHAEEWCDYPFFPQIFRQAGFFVNMCDNQTPSATEEDFEKSGRLLLHNRTIAKNCYSAVTPIRHQYDLDNILEFEEINKANTPARSLLIFHLMGQHVYASERYPHVEPFNRFSAVDYPQSTSYLDINHRQLIAHWDNATLYNDSVVAHIIDTYRDKNAVMVYFSDHGEEVYDYRDCYGRHEPERKRVAEWAHCVFDVPFFVWCSDEYKRRHPDIVKRIIRATGRRYSTDLVSNTIISLVGIRTPYYRDRHDVLSDAYVSPRRFIHSSDGQVFDYDAVTGGGKNDSSLRHP